ncbi:hypothetical protein PanWU01x14_092110 [Parasponia andersonii]|uniref:Uncharacterized protein n=1 Tax=Parasponia andersonii TaxID=3476 RepID=A0A2P5D6I5_PARAD|nr:hypothetical protein PanWU01x14_092110 [Parasponia andersonii]
MEDGFIITTTPISSTSSTKMSPRLGIKIWTKTTTILLIRRIIGLATRDTSMTTVVVEGG